MVPIVVRTILLKAVQGVISFDEAVEALAALDVQCDACDVCGNAGRPKNGERCGHCGNACRPRPRRQRLARFV